MTANWELFARDPRTWQIPNQGVTKVGPPQDESDWQVLRWEVESFVCDGEYARGLERILNAYLAGLSSPEQTAVWVSGFYGSGKSHLTRMLAELWVDRELPGGGTARSLATLPADISDAFAELDTIGRRSGGRWAATGKLGSGAGDAYRLAFLAILLESAGLPTKYPAARFALMLMSEGVYDAVVEDLKSRGKGPRSEFLQLYVSTRLHEIVLEHLPDLATDAAELRELLRMEYPPVDDVSDDDLRDTMRLILESQSSDGDVPHTVIVLDEVQQYVGTDNERLEHVQNISELVSSNFDSRVMIVATGQSALAGNPLLSKIQDRFFTKVELSDRDVEQVTRELVLRKKPQLIPELDEAIDDVRGEIDRHLATTRIGPKPRDVESLPLDYPILPVRRRLWENMLRAVDVSGGSGQLRTQLRMTHEANQQVAEAAVPSAVGADYIYFDQAQGMLSGRVLSQDLYQRIIDYDDGSFEGKLRQRVLALVFMLSKLPREAGADLEVRARPETLAELLVSDLTTGSGFLKDQVDAALAALVEDGALVQIDGEYSLQTPAGAELQRKFREQVQRVKNSAADMSTIRNEALKEGVNRDLSGLVTNQGVSRVPRKIAITFGGDQPDATGQQIPVWVQSEWAVSAKSVEDAARIGGVDDPTVYVFLPKVDAPGLEHALARSKAADLVLSGEPAAHTPESQDARRALEAERDAARTQVNRRVGDIMSEAVVRQGGGTEVDAPGGSRGKVDAALDAALLRKFPRFSDGDHADWSKVAQRAREGNAKAIEAVGHQGDVAAHPVTKAILQYLAGTPKSGAQVREHFTGGDYGWPRDAVDGALLALVAAGQIEAKDRSRRAVDAGSIRTSDIGSTTFESGGPVVSATDRLKVKGILSDMGIVVEGGAYGEAIARMVERLEQAAARATGQEPLPESIDMFALDHVKKTDGKAAMLAVISNEAELRALNTRLTELGSRVEPRMQQWGLLDRLRRHAQGTSIGTEHEAAIDAIRTGRQVLDSPDPVEPIIQSYVDGLRTEIAELHGLQAIAVEDGRERIMATPQWAVVGAEKGEAVLGSNQLSVSPEPKLATPADVVAALDAVPLDAWRTRIEAVPAREAKAMADLAKLAQPEAKVVSLNLPNRIIKTPEDIDTYLAELRSLLERNLTDGTHLSI